MTGNDGALGRLLEQVGAGTDCLVDGSSAASRSLFARVAAAAAARAEIITVVSPLGELGLSALIAQVSGRPDFDEQDDAVLELGFKRLTAPDRPTVLMLWAPQGIALPALRYLQYVGRSAPGLVLVTLCSPALDAALEQPGAAAIRLRLRAAPAIVADEAVAAPPPAELPPLAAVGPIPISAPARRRAWLLPWAAAMVSVAAASVIVVQLSRVPNVEAPVPVPAAASASASVSSSVPVPVPVPVVVPTTPAAPVPAVTQTATVIEPAPAAVEKPLAIQPPAAPPITFPAPAALPLPPLVKPDRVLHARRADPKPRSMMRAPRPSADWRADELTQYTWENRIPPWQHRQPRWSEEPMPGGYVVDRYGTPYYPFSR